MLAYCSACSRQDWEECPVTFNPEDVEAFDETTLEDGELPPFHAKCPPLGCGKNNGWYVPTTYCEQIVVVGMREFMGGCRYLYPMGECAQNHAYNNGCGLIAQQYAHDRVASQASISLNLVVINAIATFVACCLCFKRRDEARRHNNTKTTRHVLCSFFWISTRRSCPSSFSPPFVLRTCCRRSTRRRWPAGGSTRASGA